MFGMQIGQMGQVGGFSWTRLIASMYQNGEQGAWYDPSDMSTLFQDSAGTTPVTAVEQPVGLMLDKSGRGNHALQATTTKRPTYSRRVNLLTKTEQFADAEWSARLFGNWTANNARSAATAPSPLGDFTASTLSFTAPQGSVSVGQRAAVSPGAYRVLLWVRLTPGVSSPGSAFLNIGVANGNSNAWVAPYSNILNIGPQLTESWKLFTLDHTIPASGVNQIELLINKGSSADSCSVDVWGASLTLATDAHLPYQWVNTATDYDAAGFPHYLAFNGTNTTYTTPSIDFTGTDKMTVWAGVRKNSDAASAVVAELSANVGLNTGGFVVFAPLTAAANYAFGSRGTSAGTASAVTTDIYASPNTSVLTAIGDISGDVSSIRVNGATITTTTTDQGTGNYGNYPLYIGARAGASLFFNGRLYSLIVRGAATPLPQIEAVETLIRQKMRLP